VRARAEAGDVVNDDGQRGDRVVRVWAQVGRQARGAPVSVAHVCAAAVAGVAVDGAGVSVMTSPTVRDTVHATDRVAGELEEWQLTFGQGPCLDAFTDGGPVLVVDLRSAESAARWPVFTPAALGSGAQAVFALPLQVGAIRVGVLDLYRSRPGGLSPHELADALAFADTAGMLLLDTAAGTQPDTADLAWQRDDPTAHQARVHQATGMILVQLGVGAEAAFARLRAYAYAHDRRLGDVARDVVERRLRFDPDPPLGGHDEP
jgi:ANTAR domain